MFRVSDSSPATGDALKEARTGSLSAVSGLGNVGTSFVQLIGSGLGILSLSLVVILLVLLGATALGLGIATYGDELSGAFDSAFTATWSTFYRTVVLGIADPLLSLWNVFIPFSNALNGSWRIFRTNLYQQMFECEAVNWGDVALELRDTIGSLAESIVRFILSVFQDDFNLYTPVRHLQGALTLSAPVIDC